MGLTDLQSHIERGIPNAIRIVDLLKLTNGKKGPSPVKIVVDGECCLDRLYGGFFPDWVCGGQWNKMEQFLTNFSTVLRNSPLDLVVFFNGCLEPERLSSEWCKSQEVTYARLVEIQKHVTSKKKPPPKVWWIPPAFLRSALRLAFRGFNMKVMCSLDDHHKDVLRFIKKGNFDGILADDSEYLLFDSAPKYFSAQKLKLTFRGSLDTAEVNLGKVLESLDLPKERFLIFAAILGNHILPEEDLTTFYTALGIQNLQSKISVIEKVAQFVRTLESLDKEKIGDSIIWQANETSNVSLRNKVLKCLNYYGALGQSPKANRASNSKQNNGKASDGGKKTEKVKVKETQPDDGGEESSASASVSAALPSDNESLEQVTKLFDESEDSSIEADGAEADEVATSTEGPTSNIPESVSPVPIREKTKEGSLPSSVDKLVYRVSYSIESVATNRHRNGIMSPYICQILRHKEIRLPLNIEDIKNSPDLPKAHEVFRPLRQRVYAILFNLHHIQFVAKKNSEKEPTIFVKESRYDPTTKTVKTIGVPAVPVGWAVPTVEKLWLGVGEEAKTKRIRIFLSCMKSEKQILLNSSIVPQQLLVLCCVLRYILASEKKVLRRTELDALIAQALILELTEPNIAQDIEIANLTMRGVHLSHLFMEGVEMALLLNDACGAPIPFTYFAPWYFFNGKIFNFVLEQLTLGKQLPEICGYKMSIIFRINEIRSAIFEGLKPQFAAQPINSFFQGPGPLMPGMLPLPNRFPYQVDQRGMNSSAGGFPGRQFVGNMNGNSAVQNQIGNFIPGRSAVAGPHAYNGFQIPGFTTRPLLDQSSSVRGRGGIASSRRGAQRGGQLEIAGTVVGSWGANNNFGRNNVQMPGLMGRSPMQPFGGGLANPMQLNSQPGHVRISGYKLPNNRSHGPHSGPQQQSSKSKRFQKKSALKKSATGSASGTNGEGSVATGETETAVTSVTPKPKGVSFKDDASIHRGNDGSGDARILNDVEQGLGQISLQGRPEQTTSSQNQTQTRQQLHQSS